MRYAGIDVGAKQLCVAWVGLTGDQRQTTDTAVFENTPAGFKTLLTRFKKQSVKRVVLEATGVYHLDLALALHASQQLEVMVLNPRAAKHFAQARMARTKTDAVDALLLAEYAQCMPFEPWQPPSHAVLALRACSRRLAALSHQRMQAKNQLHAWLSTESTPAFIVDDVHLSIRQLDEQIASLEAQTLRLIEADASILASFELLISIKGVGQKSAIQLLGELLVLPNDMRAKQWVAMAGLDPRHHQSGTSVDKQARISKAGNRYLRTALFMPALSAKQHVPEVKAYFEHLVNERGLKRIQAVCAVMRKLLHAIHAMWRSQKPFDPTCFYQPLSADGA